MNNMSIYAVKLYKLNGMQWVFDDPTNNIYREAFVAGADTLIDKIIARDHNLDEVKNKEFVLTFSLIDFPGSTIIERLSQKAAMSYGANELVESGSWWHSDPEDQLLWLCPTLSVYADDEVDTLFFQIKTN